MQSNTNKKQRNKLKMSFDDIMLLVLSEPCIHTDTHALNITKADWVILVPKHTSTQ